MGLLDWFKDKDNDENDENPGPKYDPHVGSGWYPGKDGSGDLPDWVHELKRSDYSGVFRRGSE